MNGRSVLIIAYDYPPRGWSGVQRTAKFARYLPEFGWRPRVLTPREWFLPGPLDPTLLDEVAEVPVVRTDIRTNEGFVEMFRRGARWFEPALRLLGKDAEWVAEGLRWRYGRWLVPDYAAGWVVPAVRAGLRMIRAERPDVLFATTPPSSAIVIGAILSTLTRVPLVLDFRDLWARYPNPVETARWREWLVPHMERFVVRCASAVVNVTEHNRRVMQSDHPGPERRLFRTIYNGYDRDDLPRAVGDSQDRRGDRMTLSYVGSLYGRQTPEYLLAAVARLREDERRWLRLRFVGHPGDYEDMLRERRWADVVDLAGVVHHDEAVREMVAADVLWLVIGVGGEGVLAGKVYEYMASGRPILATVPEGAEVSRLLERAGGATIVGTADVAGIASALGRMIAAWREGALVADRDTGFVESFERRELTRRLAEVLDECA